ncbi:hypothetical protein [Mesorhizobium sp. M0185]|uniref:hypothetical protein n=1 Tax=Mesorhizobium sp. M0185 TaxID=2956907 RepID=UPI00333D24DB
MSKTKLRPPLLNPSTMQGNITNPDVPEVAGVLSALGQLTGLWDGLDAVRTTSDPLITKEAAALRYLDNYRKATALATQAVRSAGMKVLEAKDRLRHEARGRAGLLATYPDGQELRTVLRSMSQKDRDAAILHAVSNGDHAVVAALQAHELLVGHTSRPLKSIVDDFIAERAPEEMSRIADLDSAAEHLQLAWQMFAKSVEGMRDLQGERDGEQGTKAAREAEAKLGLALRGAAAP